MSTPVQKKTRRRKRKYAWDAISRKQAQSRKTLPLVTEEKQEKKAKSAKGSEPRTYQPFLDSFAAFLRANFKPLIDLILGNIYWPSSIRASKIEDMKLTSWIVVNGLPAVTEGIIYRLGWSSEDRASPRYAPTMDTGHCFIDDQGIVKECLQKFDGLLEKVSHEVNVNLQYELEEWLTGKEGSALYKSISDTTPKGEEGMASVSDSKNLYEGDIEKFVICVAGIALLLYYKSQETEIGNGLELEDEVCHLELRSSLDINFAYKEDDLKLPKSGDELQITDQLRGTVVSHAEGESIEKGVKSATLRLHFGNIFHRT